LFLLRSADKRGRAKNHYDVVELFFLNNQKYGTLSRGEEIIINGKLMKNIK